MGKKWVQPGCARCGKDVPKYRRLCVDCRPKPANRICTVCAKHIPTSERRGCSTCSVECSKVAIDAAHEAARKRVTRACKQCGVPFETRPSENVLYCGDECKKIGIASIVESRRKRSVCVVCGVEFAGKRSTCGIECHAAYARKMADLNSRMGVRTEWQRAKRKAQDQRRYKGKDKHIVIARLNEQQGGVCAICASAGEPLGDGRSGLVLDHCHQSGVPRSLLCTRCNAALGLMRESVDLILKLGEYAERWSNYSKGILGTLT